MEARHRKGFALAAMLLMLAASLAMPAGWAAPLEVYGRLPGLEDVALSPDGSRLAFIRTSENNRLLAIHDFTTGKVIAGLRVGQVKLRSIAWADNEHLLVLTSVTALPFGFIGAEREWYQLQSFDVVTHKSAMYPDADRLDHDAPRIMNVTSGNIMIRQVEGHTVLFFAGFYVSNRTLPALFRVDLQTGYERIVREGNAGTVEWLVDDNGEVAAEEEYDDKGQRWLIREHRDGHMREVASGHEAIDYPRLLGFGPEPETLLMRMIEDGKPEWRLLSLRDGSFGAPMAERRVMESPIEDFQTHRMIGGVHSDDVPHYVFFDPKVQAKWDAIVRAFEGAQVRFVSHSNDFKKILVLVDGPQFGYCYQLVDMTTHKADMVGDVYDGVTRPLEIRRITYPAADGLQIPAYLTLPHGKPEKNLPLVILAHGGPATRDSLRFDWWAQALADQGYLVLQPNFRGSDLDLKFLSAGFGEWGRKMQTDLSDGVRYLVKQGMADPARVCIIGASYGGYAALAGVTLDPGVYRCAVSIAGPSDLKRMLQWEDNNHSQHTLRYWDRFMGVSGPGDPVLEQISPIKHLDAVNVPVMMIHGRDDTVVPYEQSSIMFDAMKRAKRDVEMVTLKKEDHWLSRSETRLQMLQSSVAFLRAHNPPD
jgi:dipeptidyl aminopeptidase/acylaminoacyl peptidase